VLSSRLVAQRSGQDLQVLDQRYTATMIAMLTNEERRAAYLTAAGLSYSAYVRDYFYRNVGQCSGVCAAGEGPRGSAR
jgi:hypothetical protein